MLDRESEVPKIKLTDLVKFLHLGYMIHHVIFLLSLHNFFIHSTLPIPIVIGHAGLGGWCRLVMYDPTSDTGSTDAYTRQMEYWLVISHHTTCRTGSPACFQVGYSSASWAVSHNAIFWNFQVRSSANDCKWELKRVFLGIPIHKCIVGILFTCCKI